jgi:hypothetical protein
MSVRTPSQAPSPTPQSEPPYPRRVGLALVALVLLLAGAFYGATQLVNNAATSGQSDVAPTETAIAQAVATLAAAPTRTPASQATAVPQAASAVQPTAAPTVAAAAAKEAPTLVPTARLAAAAAPTVQATSQPAVAPTAEPTVFSPTVTPVDKALDEEVRTAYLHYFDVRDQALYTNDATGLDDVVEGPLLAALEQTIADQQAQGEALVVDIRHQYSIVHIEGDPDDEVAVVDYYKDLSYSVDATTHEPLPGQTIPSSPDEAPQVNVVYRLRNIRGVWKVIGRYSNVDSQASP